MSSKDRGSEGSGRDEAASPPESLPIVYDDEEEEPGFDEEAIDDGPRTILITGASGNIGRKLRTAWEEVYDLVLVDAKADPDDDEVEVADLSVLDEGWMSLFHGVDTVIHLAATPNEHASWEELVAPNMDAV